MKDSTQYLITILLTVSANMEFLASMGTLILQNVTSQDAGTYHCAATNYITGQTVASQFSITLRVVPKGVREAPHFLSTPCTNYTIQAGNSVSSVWSHIKFKCWNFSYTFCITSLPNNKHIDFCACKHDFRSVGQGVLSKEKQKHF
jgi:hypothetical protein